MSREWGLWGSLALGQMVGLVYAINVAHAWGLSERALRRVLLVLIAVPSAATLAMLTFCARDRWWDWPWPLQAYAAACLLIAWVALPGCSLARLLRRPPTGISEQSTEFDFQAEEGTAALNGPGRYAWLLRLPGNESLRLRKREWQVELPDLPEAWDGLSLVHVSDLHFSPCFQRLYFERVAEEAASWDADLVLFTGDLLDDDEAIEWIVPVFSRLRARLGAYAILGNHDRLHNPRAITARLEDAGFEDLEGRWRSLEVEGARLSVGGTSFPWGPRLDLQAAGEADFRIVLSHSPDLFYRGAAAGIDLMLAGHNHGGQVRLPGLGPIFMPSRYSRQFDRGFFRSGKTLIHVSQGVAGKHPIRIGCTPEISRLVLKVRRGRWGERGKGRRIIAGQPAQM